MFNFKVFDSSRVPQRNPWFCAGLTSSFPDLATTTHSDSNPALSSSVSVPCAHNATNSHPTEMPAVKIFSVPRSTSTCPEPTQLSLEEAQSSESLKDQVLVFQYRGKFYATDHQCPHSSFPLSQGTIYDIEDFGIVLSAGIACSKHGWAFDLHTGESDRGNYRLRIWDIELRERRLQRSDEDTDSISDKEVWVRKR